MRMFSLNLTILRARVGASKNKVFGFFDRPHPGLPPEGEGAKPRRLKIVSNQLLIKAW
jgi:hypothetical protein